MADLLHPLVVDLGKAKREQVKALMLGRGDLVSNVKEALDQIREGLGADASGKRLLPIVVVYEKKRSRRVLKLPLPF